MEKPDHEQLQRMLAKLKLSAAHRKALHRIDRCCHGGIVSYRLPLRFRLDCANGLYNA